MMLSHLPHLTRIAPAPRPLVVLLAVSAALLALSLSWALLDPRLLDGGPVWAKPLKFAISFVLFFGTLALADSRLSPAWRDGWMLRGATLGMASALILEMGYMVFQAAQGQASHFNLSSPFHALMYQLMGLGALLLVLGTALFGWAALRDSQADLTPALRLGIGWGFILSCLLTLVTAVTMSAMSSHFIGIPGPDAATIPLLGWSAAVGDLRPAHFVALHAMQAMPLLALLIDRPGRGPALFWLGSGLYVALTLGLFVQALLGLPLVRL